ncbi:Pvc16 family protein [Streptomyces chrestomyceticus]|uniref:Pvc16 family protein n=1 Tax=Streptomyces chrestomyceticus TaxID=68185 RepID=UPI0019D2FDE0|nr:Pvc16 family protein [Streptomyces chrestomyceticus]
MIEQVDKLLRRMAEEVLTLLRLSGPAPVISFDVPDGTWSKPRIGPDRPSTPEVNFYLYELREDISRRQDQMCLEDESPRSESVGKQFDVNTLLPHRPPRSFTLSYMATAWAAQPYDAHRMLEAVLTRLCWEDTLHVYTPPGPSEFVVKPDPTAGSVLAALHPLTSIRIAQPPENRGVGELWSALGTPPRPFVDIAVTLPLETFALQPTAARCPEVLDAGQGLDVGGEPEERHRHLLVPKAKDAPATDPSGRLAADTEGAPSAPRPSPHAPTT